LSTVGVSVGCWRSQTGLMPPLGLFLFCDAGVSLSETGEPFRRGGFNQIELSWSLPFTRSILHTS
jgi:hypothetical protein